MNPSPYDLVLIYSNVIITAVNILLVPFLIKRLQMIYRRFHVSYFILRTLHVASCFFITITLLPTSITILKNNELDITKFPQTDFIFYRIGAIEMSSIGILLRFSTIGLFVERSIATYCFENYEHKSSGLMGTAYQAHLYPFEVHVGAVVFVDCACFLGKKNCDRENVPGRSDIQLVNIFGKQINRTQSQREYFDMLQKEWS
ncbi:hypothetical protein FO519_005851 [Halicephalobus sp. NKZ332]|nr:hypothetical protein FO519_005851 [Halicephalobus sp. NKZ332]